MVQLAITSAGVAAVFMLPDLNQYLKNNSWLAVPLLIIAITLMCGIACCKGCSRKVPMNYICLLGYTLVITLLCMMYSGYKNPEAVLLCVSMVTCMTAGITALGCLLKGEMYWCYGMLIGPICGTGPIVLYITFGILTK